MERKCGNCNYFKTHSMAKSISICFVTNEIKEKDDYCSKAEYFQPKDEERSH